MNSTVGHHQYIPLTKLTPSPLNHRKRFDPQKMDELTESVRAQGVICPILVRPLDGDQKFEVVAGERRYRAAKKAGLVDIPAIVRELTDPQALALQVIENGQREDVHALEEAEGYEALLKCRTGKDAYTPDRIAEMVGKSKAYVYARLKLLALGKDQRQAFYDGHLDASRALLLARIPVPDLQERAMKEILEDRYGRGPMSYRDAADHIQDEYMLRLKEAPFKTDDAELVPSAGPCTTCPKRSGNQPEIFADIKSADVCTDPKCFGVKKGAHFVKIKAAAVAKGKEVVSGKDARAYVKLDDRCTSDPKYRTYREVLGKQAPTPALMPDTRGAKPKLVEVVKKEDIEAILEKKGATQPKGPTIDEQRDEREQQLEFTRRLFKHVIAALPKQLGKDELTWMVTEELYSDADTEIVQELLLPTGKGKSPGVSQQLIAKAIPQLDAEGLTRLWLALYLSNDVNEWGDGKRLAAAAKLYGVDVAAIKTAMKAEAKAKTKEAAASKEKAPA